MTRLWTASSQAGSMAAVVKPYKIEGMLKVLQKVLAERE